MESQKKTNVPLEDAQTEAGTGWYTRYVMCVAGLSVFAGFTNVQAMSIVITASDCDLALTSSQKGILTSIGYLGMVFSSQLMGFLADSFGRRKVILWCTGLIALVSILASFSPVAEGLMVAFFVNGFLIGGIFTPAYVYVSEFMPQASRATGFLVASSFGSLANIFLPSFAWLILPLPVQIPLPFGGLIYTSWRLYTALLSLPQLAAWLALYPLSDTPKYLLNAGEHQATLNLLQEIYSKNRSRPKEEFPIASLCLDAADGKPKLQEANRSLGTHLSNLVEQTSAIFRRPLLPYTIISCLISLTEVGGYNTMVLWLGEETQRLTQYKESHASYDVSICDVMSAPSANLGGSTGDFRCGVNFTGYIPNMAVGFLQFCFFYIVNFLVRYTGGKLMASVGCYTKRVMVTTGLVVFSALLGMQTMSVVIPAADCHLHLTTSQKGFLTSSAFSGMIFSSHLMGFLADSCGRKRVMLACNNLAVLLTVLSSLSPDPYTLMVVTFLNGFVLGGVFTPAYVFVSEFCPASVRTTGLLVCTAIASLATVYLPAVAWFIMPLEVHIPLFGDTAFTSWRLYLALLALPNLGTNFLLRCLPETPKFVLNAGDHEQTMVILRTIYAANMRKEKHEYPVESVILDATDQQSLEKETTSQSRNERSYLRIMIEQAVTLFTPPFLLGMLMACGIIFGVVGTYNMIALWIPEHTRQLMLYTDGQPYSNATLCQVLSRNLHQQEFEEEAVGSGGGICEIDYQIFLASLIVGLLQSSFFLIMSLVAHKVKGKTLIISFTLLTIGALFNLIFAKSFYLTLIGLATTVILLLSIFPLCYGLAVDIFPTSLRSTATSIIMLCGRIGAAVGNQVVGILLYSHCTAAYWGMILILVGVIICTIFIPIKKK